MAGDGPEYTEPADRTLRGIADTQAKRDGSTTAPQRVHPACVASSFACPLHQS